MAVSKTKSHKSTPRKSKVTKDITDAFPIQNPIESTTLPDLNLGDEVKDTLTKTTPPTDDNKEVQLPEFNLETDIVNTDIPVDTEIVNTDIPVDTENNAESEFTDDSQDENILEAQNAFDMSINNDDINVNTETTNSATDSEIQPLEEPSIEPELIENTQIETENTLDTSMQSNNETESTPNANNNDSTSVNNETETVIIPVMDVAPQGEAHSDDPFDGLNIVFDEPKAVLDTQAPATDQIIPNTPETPAAETTETVENNTFVDPFLTKKETATIAEEASKETGNQASLDTMLENLDTIPAATNATTATVTSNITNAITGMDGKKKKMLLVGSGVLGLVVLAGASYMVFSTMFPSDNIGNQLKADIAGPVIATGANNTGTDAISTGTDTNVLDDIISGTENKIPEEELPLGTSSDSFGDEDQLPAGTVIPDTTPIYTGAEEEELTANVTPETDGALKTLDEQVDKLKQLLSLAKAKNDNTIIKQIALTLKSIRAVKEKIVGNDFTSFSTEIEPDMSKINFDIDKLTATLVQ